MGVGVDMVAGVVVIETCRMSVSVSVSMLCELCGLRRVVGKGGVGEGRSER